MKKKAFGIARRSLLGSAAAASCLAATVGLADERERRPFFAAHELPIGLQLYTLGEAPYKDLQGTLRTLAAIGYRTVETVGLMNTTAAELRQALDSAGLACPSAHVPLQSDGTGPSLVGDTPRLAADLHRIGAKYVVVPSLPVMPRRGEPLEGEDRLDFAGRAAREMTADDWRRAAAVLNDKGAALKREGLDLAYHNHDVEFAGHGSKTGYDVLIENTDPDLVCFEIDVGWVAAAGVDPVPVLHAHPGRFLLMHVKDVKSSTVPGKAFQMEPANVGAGALDWKAILPVAYDVGVRYYYVEQEAPFTEPRMDAVRKDYNYLARLV